MLNAGGLPVRPFRAIVSSELLAAIDRTEPACPLDTDAAPGTRPRPSLFSAGSDPRQAVKESCHEQPQAQAPRPGPSQRQLRAGELMRHALVEILREEEINDPALDGVSVTVTEVRMGPDLRHATCFVEPLGGRRATPARGGRQGAEPHAEVPARPRWAATSTCVHARTCTSATTRASTSRRADGPAVRRPARAPGPDARRTAATLEGRGLMARRKKGEAVSGWICLDKPYDLGSTQAVSRVRRLFNAQKAGHAGTLDPLATGILPIALGEATKTVPFLVDADKAYRFTIAWGRTTATYDREGETIADVRRAPDAAAQVEAALPRLRRRDRARSRRPIRRSRWTASAPTTWPAPARRWSWRRAR